MPASPDLYATAAQVIPTLAIAAALEMRLLDAVGEESRPRYRRVPALTGFTMFLVMLIGLVAAADALFQGGTQTKSELALCGVLAGVVLVFLPVLIVFIRDVAHFDEHGWVLDAVTVLAATVFIVAVVR
jgi:hypothetical protein